MPDTVVVRVEPGSLTAKPGSQASADVTVRNRTEEVGNYLLSVEGLPGGWASLTPNQVSAFPMQSIQSKLVLQLPADARGATYHATVRAVSQDNPALTGSVALDVDVPAPVQSTGFVPPLTVPESRTSGQTSRTTTQTTPPPPPPPRTQTASQIEVLAEQLKEAKVPPPAMQWRISLHNAGTVLDTFAFSISGVKPAWVRLEPAQLTLKPDERATALLTVTPTPDTAAGRYAFVLRTFSHLNMSQRTELSLALDVRASAGYQMSIDPKEAEAQGQRDFRVILASNPASNTDLYLSLSAADQDAACDYTFDQPQVFLPAKQSVASTMRMRPRGIVNAGERKTYTFRVTATERNNALPPQVAEGRLTQVAAAPLRLVLRPQVMAGDLEGDYVLLAINPSGVETALVFTGDDPEASCEYTFQPQRLNLPAGGEAQVKLKVKARTNFEGEGQKEYPFTISATRAGDMVPAASVQGKFQQKQLKPVTLTLIPPQASDTGAVTYTVRATNPRPRPVQILLSAQDEADAVAFTFRPAEINLSAGAEGSAALTARPKDRLMQGEQRRVHKFVVTGAVDGAATPPTAKGTLAQIPGLDMSGTAGTLLKLMIWGIRWLLALLVVWFLVTMLYAGIEVVGCNFSPTRGAPFTPPPGSSAQGYQCLPDPDNALGKLLNPTVIFSTQLSHTIVDYSPFQLIARPIIQFMLVAKTLIIRS